MSAIQKNTFYNLDCEIGLEKLFEQDVKIDGVITSPPYNIIRPNSTDRGYDEYKDGMSNEEYIKWTLRLFKAMDKVLKPNGKILYNMSYGAENTECMSLTIAEILKSTEFTLADIIVWKKHSATPNNVSKNRLTRICEFIYVFCRKDELKTFDANKTVVGKRKDTEQTIYANVFNFITAKNNDENCPLNKATYSTELVEKLINIYFQRGNIILDIFGGSGTTAIACHRSNIDFYYFELSEKQTEWAKNRYAKETAQLSFAL